MTRVILEPYSSFRTESFTATVIDMGIKEFGEDAIQKAYIEFDDGGAPITYPLEAKGKPLIESIENGKAKIKNFSVGGFAEQAKKLGYQTFIDTDLENHEFGCIPELIGKVTSWEAKRGGKRIDADGNEKEGFTNFTLTKIEGGVTPSQPTTQPAHKPAEKPQGSTQTAKQPPIDTKRWEEVLSVILTQPMTLGEIQKAVNTTFKDESMALAKTRTAAIKALKEVGKITIDENQKYSCQ